MATTEAEIDQKTKKEYVETESPSRELVFAWGKSNGKSSMITVGDKILTAENEPWDAKSDYEVLETRLNKGSFLEVMDMRDYLHAKKRIAKFAGAVYIVLLDNGTKAVWKPRDENNIDCAIAEVAAYRASKWLEKQTARRLVPPTVIKTFRDRIGSLQLYVESPFDLWLLKDRETVNAHLDMDSLANAAAFIHVFGQWDTHPGNRIAVQDSTGITYIVLIDNEGIANRKYSRSITEKPFVRVTYGEISEEPPRFFMMKTPKRDELQKTWAPFALSEQSFNSIYQNLTGNGERDADFMFWDNGLWIQYHKQNKDALPNHVEHYPGWVAPAYEKLTLETLKNIFDVGIGNLDSYFNESFFQDIMMRKKQLMDCLAAGASSTLRTDISASVRDKLILSGGSGVSSSLSESKENKENKESIAVSGNTVGSNTSSNSPVTGTASVTVTSSSTVIPSIFSPVKTR